MRNGMIIIDADGHALDQESKFNLLQAIIINPKLSMT
jgi:hypothetical protein